MIDHLLPWFSAIIATLGLLVFQAVQTGAGGVNIAAVVIVCFGIDVFRQFQQVSLNTIVFSIEPSARSRMNAVFQVAVRADRRCVRLCLLTLILWRQVFIGQIMGTAVGTQVFLKYGWRPAAALSVAWSGFTLAALLLRGPHCKRFTWFGYEGGWELRKEKDPAGEVEAQREVTMSDGKTGGDITLVTLTETSSNLPPASTIGDP
jgi:hypothetical protein